MMDVLAGVFPAIDLTTAGGFLQLVFVELGFIVVGFAAATLVGGWASDETSGRLELVLASPLDRRRLGDSQRSGRLPRDRRDDGDPGAGHRRRSPRRRQRRRSRRWAGPS